MPRLYYEPKSIAPILQQGLSDRMPLLSQPKGGVQPALQALGQLGQTGLNVAQERQKKQSIMAAQQDYANFLSMPPDQRALPENQAVGMRAALSLGITPPQNETVAPDIWQSIQKEGQFETKAPGTKANVDAGETLARLRSRRTDAKTKPPTGYRFGANGNLEAIPGGPADAKNKDKSMKDERLRLGATGQADRIIATVDQAMSKIGNWTAGAGAGLRAIPGTPAKNLAADLQTIKANLGFAELQAMRQASPTGGALGAIAVQELEALQSTVASLDQSQSPAQLKERLSQVRQHYAAWKDAVNKGSAPAAPDPANDAILDQYGAP